VSRSTKQRRKGQARDAIAVLAQWWPLTFAIYAPRHAPLKVDIHQDILAHAEGAITERVGKITADEAAHAAEKLARYQARLSRPRSTTKPTRIVPNKHSAPTEMTKTSTIPTGPKRIGFADLRAAALKRKAATS
jgi:sRNA-binding protein